MTIEEVIKDLKMSLRMWGRKPQKESYEVAIRSLEAWQKVLGDISQYIENASEHETPYDNGRHDGAIDIYNRIGAYLKEVDA